MAEQSLKLCAYTLTSIAGWKPGMPNEITATCACKARITVVRGQLMPHITGRSTK